MTNFSFGSGDSLPLVTDVFRDRDGNPVDLTGAVVTLPLEPIGKGDTVVRPVSIIGDPKAAIVQAKIFDPWTVLSGVFRGRFKAVLPSTETISWPRDYQYTFSVNADGSGGTPSVPPAPPAWSVDGVATGAVQLVAMLPPTEDATVRVKTLRAEFYLDRSSTLAADNVTVADAVGGGRWIRKTGGDLFWQAQAAWFYDNAAGSDEASGADSGHPIKSIAEIWRRVMGATVLGDITLTIVGTLSDAEGAVFTALQASQPTRTWSPL